MQVKIAARSMWKYTKLYNMLMWYRSELKKLGIDPEDFRKYL